MWLLKRLRFTCWIRHGFVGIFGFGVPICDLCLGMMMEGIMWGLFASDWDWLWISVDDLFAELLQGWSCLNFFSGRLLYFSCYSSVLVWMVRKFCFLLLLLKLNWYEKPISFYHCCLGVKLLRQYAVFQIRLLCLST